MIPHEQANSLISSPMESRLRTTLYRLLDALSNDIETGILGSSLLRELHYRILTGPQGPKLIAALRQADGAEGIGRSLKYIRHRYNEKISVDTLAQEAGMSIANYHKRFRVLTGATPLGYIKSLRLHEARLMMARQGLSAAAASAEVGYMSPSQFSREFKNFFGRTITDEISWMRVHLGESVSHGLK